MISFISKMFRFSLFSVLLLLSLEYEALGQERLRIDLQINPNVEQQFNIAAIEFSDKESQIVGGGLLPGNVIIEKASLPGKNNAYSIKIDTNNDGSISDERDYVLHIDSTITVSVKRMWPSGKASTLPYLLTYDRHIGREGVSAR